MFSAPRRALLDSHHSAGAPIAAVAHHPGMPADCRRPWRMPPHGALQEIEKMPLFMTKDPTAEEVAASPDLQAMQVRSTSFLQCWPGLALPYVTYRHLTSPTVPRRGHCCPRHVS